jgi:phage recombination protein Bet
MNEIARFSHGAAVALPSIAWSSRQLDTIKRTVAKDTNNDEFDLFIEYCKVKGLDPFSRQAIAVVFNKDKPAKRQMTIITTQDGLRVMASRCGDYRPEETEAVYEYDENLKSPVNPLGIVKATVTLWKQDSKSDKWWPVNGTAYWDEFAPIKTDDRVFEWVPTGEVYEDTGRPKKRKQIKEGCKVEDFQKLDDSGLWAKMGRNQIAKCARMQGLRGGWPETFSGVYAEEEMDRARVADLTASEMVDMEREERRAKAISMSTDEYPWVTNEGELIFVPAGKFSDHVCKVLREGKSAEEIDTILVRNREGMARFWKVHKDEALMLRKEVDGVIKSVQQTEKVA